MKIVTQGTLSESVLQRVRDGVPDAQIVSTTSGEELLKEIKDAEALIGTITSPLLEAAGQLRWVQSFTAGLEHVMFDALIKSRLTMTNMRGIYDDQGADHALALMLGLAKGFPRFIRQQLEARYDKTTHERVDLTGKTLGILGLGGIGYALAKRGHVCGMKVIATDARRTDCPPEVSALWLPKRLDDLLGQSDFVVSCVPFTPQTQGLMTLERFRKMKASAYFINISRGAVVKLDDLVTALDEGLVAGAGLDVYEQEPLPSEHPLWKQQNIIMTPHIAAGGADINTTRRDDLLSENIYRFVRGEPLLNVVDKANWF